MASPVQASSLRASSLRASLLKRADLQGLSRQPLHQARNWSKAHVFLVEWPLNSGREVVVKDLSGAPMWFRVLWGRMLLGREARAMQILEDIEGVPAFLGRVDADAIVMERAPGSPLQGAAPGHVEEAVLHKIERILEAVHARGVTHGDLHASNVLADEMGNVWLIDWATASIFPSRAGSDSARKWSFEEWRALDRRALAKLKVLHAPHLLSSDERDLLVNGGSRLYRGVKSARRGLDRLRGKKRGRRASLLENFVAGEQKPRQ